MNTMQFTSQEILETYASSDRPFALVAKEGTDDVFLLSGDVASLAHLGDIPRIAKPPPGEFCYESLSMIPFAQAKELGMRVIDDGTPIRCMRITEQVRLSIGDVLAAFPEDRLELDADPVMKQTEAEFAEDVGRIVETEIRKGNVCNVVLSVEISAKIRDMSPRKALTIFSNLLRKEFGAYMTFFFYDGLQFHIGASPERQITVDHGVVTMNPISGTYRKTNLLIDPAAFKEFLRDPKEINELFMCLDEEMKQMAKMCEDGGTVVGPLLKEMSGVVHTEYLLVGKSRGDCIDLLRASMHAPTVTGSPNEEAFRVIADLEKEPRGYYAGEIVLLGHHADGTEFLDSAIAIRTMRVLPNGLVTMRVGASIVRDSPPEGEAQEVVAKGGGATRALKPSMVPSPGPQLPSVMDPETQELLRSRNAHLNRFLLEDQEGAPRAIQALSGKKITIVDFEDAFTYVLRHMLRAAGAQAEVVRFDAFDAAADDADIVIVGPGPGDPRDESKPKMRKLSDITTHMLENKRPLLSVCLGHQKLCEKLGIEVRQREEPAQGVQREVDLFGESQQLGFYNAYAGFCDEKIEGVEISSGDDGEIFAVRGNYFSGFQFHPESIMSERGFEVLTSELMRLIQ